MESIHVEKAVLNWPISVSLTQSGPDWLVNIVGGCAPHIGSISVAYVENDEVVLQKILLPTHRDDVVGDRFAKVLAMRFHATVTVICGIHYETPGKEGLRQIVDCGESLLQEILRQTSGRNGR